MFLFHFFFTAPFIYFQELNVMRLLTILWLLVNMVFTLFLLAFGVSYIS